MAAVRAWLVAALAASAALAALHPGALAGAPPCTLAAGATALTAAAQNDGGSGGDAPGAREGAVPVAHEGYVWGSMDPPLQGARDHADWFAMELAGEGERVTLSLITDYGVVPTYGIFLEVYPPGAARAAHRGTADTGPLTFVASEPGWWGVLVGVQPMPLAVPPPAGPCLPEALPASPAPAPDGAQNYGMYYGCKPFCAPRAKA